MKEVIWTLAGFLLLVLVMDIISRRITKQYILLFILSCLVVALMKDIRAIPLLGFGSVFLLSSNVRRWLFLILLFVFVWYGGWLGISILGVLDLLIWTEEKNSRYARLFSGWWSLVMIHSGIFVQGVEKEMCLPLIWFLMLFSVYKVLSSPHRQWNEYLFLNTLRVLSIYFGGEKLILLFVLFPLFLSDKIDKENERIPVSWLAVIISSGVIIGLIVSLLMLEGRYFPIVWVLGRLRVGEILALIMLFSWQEIWWNLMLNLNSLPVLGWGPKIYISYVASRILRCDLLSTEKVRELLIRYGVGLRMVWNCLRWYWVRLWFVIGISGVIWYVSSIR